MPLIEQLIGADAERQRNRALLTLTRLNPHIPAIQNKIPLENSPKPTSRRISSLLQKPAKGNTPARAAVPKRKVQ